MKVFFCLKSFNLTFIVFFLKKINKTQHITHIIIIKDEKLIIISFNFPESAEEDVEQDDSLENANVETNNCKSKNTHSNSSSRRASLADIMLSRTRKGSAPESDETKIDMPHYIIQTEKFADKKVKVRIFHFFLL